MGACGLERPVRLTGRHARWLCGQLTWHGWHWDYMQIASRQSQVCVCVCVCVCVFFFFFDTTSTSSSPLVCLLLGSTTHNPRNHRLPKLMGVKIYWHIYLLSGWRKCSETRQLRDPRSEGIGLQVSSGAGMLDTCPCYANCGNENAT